MFHNVQTLLHSVAFGISVQSDSNSASVLSQLSTNLFPQPVWHIDFPSLLVDDIKYCLLRISDKVDDPTQMNWSWYKLDNTGDPRAHLPASPTGFESLWTDEVAAPEPPPSCCQRTWLLQAFMIDEWDALGTAGQPSLPLPCLTRKGTYAPVLLVMLSTAMCRVSWWLIT